MRALIAASIEPISRLAAARRRSAEVAAGERTEAPTAW
jgi:hypothetical protein